MKKNTAEQQEQKEQQQEEDVWHSVHPSLRGGADHSSLYSHNFSLPQMAALSAVCEAILPPSPVPNFSDTNESNRSAEYSAALQAFYELSPIDIGLPSEVACLSRRLLKKKHYQTLGLALYLLSTRIGTLVIVGKKAFIPSFPFFRKFASIPLEQRQECIWNMRHHYIRKCQELFKFFKNFISWAAFTMVDRNGHNPFYDALRYRVPRSILNDSNLTPLRGFVIDVKDIRPHDRLTCNVLEKNGCKVMGDVSSLRKLRRGSYRRCREEEDMGLECDVVVVGSGAGGAVVAACLAEAGFRVVVLEKGGYFAKGDLSLLEGPSLYAMYEESGYILTEEMDMLMLAGSTLGGGSTVNWSASFRTPDHVRHEWASREHGLPLFLTPGYDHAMDAVWSRLGIQSEVENESFQNSVLRRGCIKLGIHVDTIPRNNPKNHNCGFCGFGCRDGSKQGANETWLLDAATHGAIIITGCLVEEVLHETSGYDQKKKSSITRGVVAVSLSDHRSQSRLYLKSQVVVAACGALQTPPLLKRSGLRNPNIGKHLHTHPVQIVWGYFPDEMVNEGFNYQGGILSAYSKAAANWETTGYGAILECNAAHPGLFSTMMPWKSGVDYKTRMSRFARTVCFIILVRDKTEGEVKTDSEGRLSIHYKICKADQESMIRGTEVGLQVMVAAGASEIGTTNTAAHTFKPSHEKSSNKGFEEFFLHEKQAAFHGLSTNLGSAHQMGSCRMGSHPSGSVVDPSCETWEVENLFLADSSVFPTALGANPMITIQSIAFCTSHCIISKLSSPSSPNHKITSFLAKMKTS